MLNSRQRAAFFAVRIFLAFICTFSECLFYRKVYENVNHRVGRYLFFILLFNAGMWNASSAFLPSSFAMYTTTLASAYAIVPATSRDTQRTLFATLLFAAGAIVGWPFALALAIPFAIEELFVLSGDQIFPASRSVWMLNRWKRLFGAGFLATLIFVGPFIIYYILELTIFTQDSRRWRRYPGLRETLHCAIQHCRLQHPLYLRSRP